MGKKTTGCSSLGSFFLESGANVGIDVIDYHKTAGDILELGRVDLYGVDFEPFDFEVDFMGDSNCWWWSKCGNRH